MVRYHGFAFLPFLLPLALAGCATSHTSFRRFSVPAQTSGGPLASGVLIDAKQRAILSLSGLRTTTTRKQIGNGTPHQTSVSTDAPVTCAEPSPDALSVIATAISGQITDPHTSLALEGAFSSSEAATELGVRNATIQILRDVFYRECEAYMNGAIDAGDYKAKTDRFVDGMVTLLAVEGLTSSQRSKPVVIAAGGKVSTAQFLTPDESVVIPQNTLLTVSSGTQIDDSAGKKIVLDQDTPIKMTRPAKFSPFTTIATLPIIRSGTTMKAVEDVQGVTDKASKYKDVEVGATSGNSKTLSVKLNVTIPKDTKVVLADSATVNTAGSGLGVTTTAGAAIPPGSAVVVIQPSSNAQYVKQIVSSFLIKDALDRHQEICDSQIRNANDEAKAASRNITLAELTAYENCMKLFQQYIVYRDSSSGKIYKLLGTSASKNMGAEKLIKKLSSKKNNKSGGKLQ